MTAQYTPISAEHLAALTEIVGAESLSTAQADIDLHARDQSHHEAHPAEVVIWPQTAEQVAALLK